MSNDGNNDNSGNVSGGEENPSGAPAAPTATPTAATPVATLITVGENEVTVSQVDQYDEFGAILQQREQESGVPPDQPITIVVNKEPEVPKRLRCSQEEHEKRIEFVRMLIRLDYTPCQIKQICIERWSTKIGRDGKPYVARGQDGRPIFKPWSFQPYYAWAKRRNSQLVEGSEDEKLAKSISYWAEKKQQAEDVIQRETKERERSASDYREAVTELNRLRGLIKALKQKKSNTVGKVWKDEVRDKMAELEDEMSFQAMKRDDAKERIQIAKHSIAESENQSERAQDRLDKLNGVQAPIKIARTTTEGKDVDKPADVEPTTLADADRELLELAEKLRARGAVEVATGDQSAN